MKYLTILALLFNISLNAQNFQLTDTQLHIGATYIISSTTTSYILNKTGDKRKAMFTGFGVAMSVGIIKELSDKRVENKDLLGNLVGATVGCLVITIPLP